MNEHDCGITNQHIKALENTMRQENTFLFVRPTEYDSTILIKEGYATKSMDIHHKSSNWGPMAGFVPCDPAFSKKLTGSPNPRAVGEKHLKAQPVQLFLKPSLLQSHQKIREEKGFVMERTLGGAAAFDYQRFTVKPIAGGSRVSRMAAMYDAQAKSHGLPEHRFVRAHDASASGTRSTLFCLVKKGDSWLVYWVQWRDASARIGSLVPLNVFAYQGPAGLNPVTGDYDMWMVAPHIGHLPKHSRIDAVVDAHGSSAASLYITQLIRTMNSACGQADNPVFNHGAEEQNYGFTQALDARLAMFTAGGTSRMVQMSQMPDVMADIQNGGYLVIWNKSYGNVDPTLSHDKNPEWVQFRSGFDTALAALRQFRSGISPARQKEIAQAWISDVQHKMPRTMQEELRQAVALRGQRMGVRQSDAPEAAIFRFHEELIKLLGRGNTSLLALNDGDFPGGFQRTRLTALRLQRSLQQAIVDATSGGGESDVKQLGAWYASHQDELGQLKQYWNIA